METPLGGTGRANYRPPSLTAADRRLHVERGRAYGYPECCVQAWVASMELGGEPAVERGVMALLPRTGRAWVPCDSCRRSSPVELSVFYFTFDAWTDYCADHGLPGELCALEVAA